MNAYIKKFIIVAVFWAVSAFGLAQTTNYFLGGNTYVSDGANWSEGVLPTVTTGYIFAGAGGYIGNGNGGPRAGNMLVVQEGGWLSSSGNDGIVITNSHWTLNGGSISSLKGITLTDCTIIVNDGAVRNDSGKSMSISSSTELTFNGGRLYGSGAIINSGTVLVNGGACTNYYYRGGGTLTVNGGQVDITGSFGNWSHLGGDWHVVVNGGTFLGPRWTTRSTTSTFVLGGTTPGQVIFDDWGSNLYNDGYPAGGPDDEQYDNRVNINFLSNTLVTLTMVRPRALDLVDNNPNVYDPVYASNQWAEALWENNQLRFHGQTKTDLGGSPDFDWVNVTNWNGLGGYQRWNYDGFTLGIAYEPPPSGTVIVIN
ncbi:hypothetical protein BVX97_05675 [bacterium E08(2017)]|nr:hypothetical protein BVX97_05675 [bacterium E08(2017)]